jgi:O-antigen ligase
LLSAATEDPVQALRSIQLWTTITALSLAPLFFGSVDRSWTAVWTIVLSASALCGAAKPLNVWQRRILCAFLAMCGAYVLVAVVQIAPDFIVRLDDPIWQRASKLLGANFPSRISSRAEIPLLAVGHFLVVVTSFMSGFFVGTSRRDSDILTAFARYSILLYAIYGLFALAFTPNMLLWAPKVAYLGSLTASFVNHNTAATFIGMGAILWLCLACLTLQSVSFNSLRLLLLIPSNERVVFSLILRSGAGLACFFALLLTGSRGGLICSCLGLLVALGLVISSKVKANSWYILGGAGIALVAILGWLTQVGRIGSQGLLDDQRWSVYGYCIDAISQRPWLGAGAGTFADLFPSLRPPDFNKWGTWDFAHSTILEIAVEMGVPIAAMIVCAAIASLYILARAALRSKGKSRGSFAAIAGIATLAYLHSLIDFSLQIPGFFIVFWILLGCWLAQSQVEKPKVWRTSARDFVPATKSAGEVAQFADARVA